MKEEEKINSLTRYIGDAKQKSSIKVTRIHKKCITKEKVNAQQPKKKNY